MYLSYQECQTRCQNLSSDTSSATLTIFKDLLNEALTKAYAVLGSQYFYGTATETTAADTSSYSLPAQCEKLHTLKVTISSVDYVATEYPGDETSWNSLTGSATSSSSDYPQYFFVKANTVEIYPESATASYTITMRFKKRVKELSADDFTTESVKTAVVGDATIVGNTGTLWTAAMAGRFLKVTNDGLWREIASVTDATNLELIREWDGTAITAGTSAYTIGEMSLLPYDLQNIPCDYTLFRYYTMKENTGLANTYKASWGEGLEQLRISAGNDTTRSEIGEDINILYSPDCPQNLS